MYNIYIIIIIIVTSLKSTETAKPEVVPQTQLSRREASKQDWRRVHGGQAAAAEQPDDGQKVWPYRWHVTSL